MDTRVATMDKPWCEVTAGNVEYTLFNLRESTEGITVADIEASTVLAKEASVQEVITAVGNIEPVNLDGIATTEQLGVVKEQIISTLVSSNGEQLENLL